jgi:hypothetical protein
MCNILAVSFPRPTPRPHTVLYRSRVASVARDGIGRPLAAIISQVSAGL